MSRSTMCRVLLFPVAASLLAGGPVPEVDSGEPDAQTEAEHSSSSRTVRKQVLTARTADGVLTVWITTKRGELRGLDVMQVRPDGTEVLVKRAYRPADLKALIPAVAAMQQTEGVALGGEVWIARIMACLAGVRDDPTPSPAGATGPERAGVA